MEFIEIENFGGRQVIMPIDNIAYITEYKNSALTDIKTCLHLKSEEKLFMSRSSIENIKIQLKYLKNDNK